MNSERFIRLIVAAASAALLMLATFLFTVTASAQLTKDINLEQCANGGGDETSDCSKKPQGGSIGWVTGNANANKSTYHIDEFIAYRYVYNALTAGRTYCGGMSWDVTDQGDPALDYIATYSNTRTLADPTLETFFEQDGQGNEQGREGFDHEAQIPPDPLLSPQLSGGSLITPVIQGNPYTGTQEMGDIRIWGAHFVPLSGTADLLHYGNDGTRGADLSIQGENHQSVEWCFQVIDKGVPSGTSQVVLAWSAHIADPSAWGDLPFPTGSPYHMRGGTTYDGFTAPRTKDGDFVEIDEQGQVVGVKNYGNVEVQLQIIDPLAITLSDLAVGPSGNRLSLVLASAAVLALALVTVLLIRDRRRLRL